MTDDQPIQNDLFSQLAEETTRKCRTCTGPIDREGSRCTKCVAKRRAKIQGLAAKGRCPLCTRPHTPNPHKHCDICRARRKAEDQQRRADNRAKGLCQCGKPTAPECKQCADCQERDRKRWTRRPPRKRDPHFCLNCGAGPLSYRARLCDTCKANAEVRQRRTWADKAAADHLCLQCCKPKPIGSGKDLCPDCLDKRKIERNTVKQRCMDGYGGGCACCGTRFLPFLTIDHINNDGAEHRTSGRLPSGGSGTVFYRWVIRHNFPSDLQCLCFNCNFAKRIQGFCPHHPTSLEFTGGTGI